MLVHYLQFVMKLTTKLQKTRPHLEIGQHTMDILNCNAFKQNPWVRKHGKRVQDWVSKLII